MDDDAVRTLGVRLLVGVDVSDSCAFALPTGTVTFLLTDLEGSSRGWEDSPEAMAVAVARHYSLLDEAIAAHGGVRPVEQGEGDSVVAAFSRASDAVAAALAIQMALSEEAWPDGAVLRARVAVHTGEAQLRDEGNYFGPAVIRCARIRAVGHGGHVLVSASTAALVADRLPTGATLVDLGPHRLRDLGRPEQIWQLVHPDIPSELRPLRSMAAFRHNLPFQLTSLIGRGSEIVDVRDLLASERLVTLTGSAGVGKTRLALAVAAESLDSHPGGVWWVELAALSDPNGIGRTALSAIGAPATPGASVERQLAVELGDEPSLLVLDNCEHLVESCAELVAGLLAANAAASVLTTSREPLGVPGEITWRVPSLPCPPPERSLDVQVLSQYDAVALFMDRARRARPSFRVTEANAPAIAQICYRLDGIPLAIELAAARCRQMTAEHISSELDDRFRVLTGGARTVMARQQTLAASVGWSHERLDEREQLVFRRLGVFSGPFPLEAAEAVVAGPGAVEPVEVFDVVSRLVDKSLVVADDGIRGEPRYRLLETLRAYAVERARAAGELTMLRDAHAAWWIGWLEPSYPIPTDDMLDRVEELHDNLKSALDWSTGDPALGLRLLRCLATVWSELGWFGEGALAVERLLTLENAERHTEAWLDAVFVCQEVVVGAHEDGRVWDDLTERAEHLAGEHGDGFRLAIARYFTGGLEEARTLRELARQRGDLYWQAAATVDLANHVAEDDPIAAKPLLADADTTARASGSRSLRDEMLLIEARAARTEGDLRKCIELGRRLLRRDRALSRPELLHVMSYAALLALDEDALRQVAAAGERLERKAPGYAVLAFNARHRLELFEGQPSTLDPEFQKRRHYWSASFGTLWLICREAIDAGEAGIAITQARAKAGSVPHGRAVLAAIEAAATAEEDRWHEALALALDHDLRLIAVDALEGLGVAASRAESWAECLRLLGAVDRLRDETGYGWRFAFEQQALDAARAEARGGLSAAAAATANSEGHYLDWRAAASYARRARGERQRPHHGWDSLTPTEQQVAALVATGLTNPQVAQRLFIARSTVKTHLDHIFTKTGVRTRAELAAEATRRGDNHN